MSDIDCEEKAVIVSDERRKDLQYWQEKAEYAEKMYGEKGANMRRICRLMIDLFLDNILKEQEFLQIDKELSKIKTYELHSI